MLNFLKKEKIQPSNPPNWGQQRCPKCNALLFEKLEGSYKNYTVRIKCRLCKEINVF